MYIRRRWKQVQYMADIFWKLWTREYLPQLQECQKWTRISCNFTVGDNVLIVDHTALPNSWVMCKVVEEIPDKNVLPDCVKAEGQPPAPHPARRASLLHLTPPGPGPASAHMTLRSNSLHVCERTVADLKIAVAGQREVFARQ
ncbi:hypothetical protein AOLI_G00098610 [Acnodon oligacanthus]